MAFVFNQELTHFVSFHFVLLFFFFIGALDLIRLRLLLRTSFYDCLRLTLLAYMSLSLTVYRRVHVQNV